MDFPGLRPHKPIIACNSPESVMGIYTLAYNIASLASAAIPSANRAYYVPFRIWSPYLVQRVWWVNGTAVAGNVDVGVHTLGGARLFSGGSTAQAGTSVLQSAAITPFLLTPGSFYMSFASSSTSAQFLRYSAQVISMQHFGVAIQASAFPLPDPATFASNSGTFMPLFGITSSTVI